MSWTTEIHADLKLIVSRFKGAIDYEDFMRWLDETLRRPGYAREFDGFIDLRQAAYKQARPEKVQALAQHMIATKFTTGRWAVLVGSPIQAALSLHYERKVATQHPMQVVSTPEAAVEFLGRSLEQLGLAAHG